MPGRTGRKNGYKFITDLEDVGSEVLVTENNLSEPQARAAMRTIALRFCDLNARLVVYIPRAVSFELDGRDEKIAAAYAEEGPDGARKFSAERVRQLAAEHDLTEVQIYNVIRRQKRQVAKRV